MIMKKLGKILLLALGFGLVTFTIGILTNPLTPVQATPGPAPVTVVNTPLPVQGTVSATVTGNVNASQNGAWNVGVSNFPATQTVSFNGVAQPVSFSNATGTPLFTRDVDNPARQPVFGGCDVINQPPTNGFVSCNIIFTSPTSSFSSVPAGQRLVIEFVSVEADVPTGTKALRFGIQTTVGNANTDVGFVPSTLIGTLNINGVNLDEYKVGQQTRIYEDTNATVRAEVLASDTTSNPYSIFVTVTGYLVNVP
jgi:hypothetical protein